MNSKFKVEVAILFQDKTWDTVFLVVEASSDTDAKGQAEEVVKQTVNDNVFHVTVVGVKLVEVEAEIPTIKTERGVVIRNLTQYPNTSYSRGYTYRFEALIDNEWWECGGPVGDWTFVIYKNERLPKHLSVQVGWWELDQIYYKKGRYAGE